MPEQADTVSWIDVRKRFPDGHEAVAGVTLHAAEGRVLALLGTSGSGKTTLLKMVNRLIEPTAGEVRVGGRPTAEWDPIALRRAVGYVIQETGLMPHLDVLANVALPLRLNGVSRERREAAGRAALELVGLPPDRFAALRPRQLSGGQRQRVGVARALVSEPRLLLMDEPFGALDPITRRELQGEFRALQRRTGTTVVLVTHDIREAARLADRVAILDSGRVAQEGPFAELLARPASPFVASFLADARDVREDGEGAA
jgi:osmoprotectant transport system ATP-binding protein